MFGKIITDKCNVFVITNLRCNEYIKSVYCELLRTGTDFIFSHNIDKNILDNKLSIISLEEKGEYVYFNLMYYDKGNTSIHKYNILLKVIIDAN